ncbi:WecB/TagA/CpsF family glycosyltransferase [Aromatoleum toluvorans]|uniref:WecB/TagA/CpsF family glycosyltransferase n=1 Tax=Aromatoleum toluvorans TaxID=92002 RepID=A0ABX1Q5Q0_9RHOO|nr:WecB/TagA/CpsF family glycosyltransferase [Aromatoleum toluvorans]NMG46091.1 WecB/TagA/CpsF family glycosyltransferase [Aromatoleum toluvorans]
MSRPPTLLQARWSQVLNRLVVIPSDDDAANLVDELAAGRQPRMLAFVNAHAMNSAVGDLEFYRALCDADVLLRDGSGMAMLFRMLDGEPGLNMNGTDFIPQLLAAYRGRRVALWGTREKWLAAAAARCAEEFGVEIVSCENGFQPPEYYCDAMRRTRPELIVLGMGMPRQESVARLVRATAAGAPLIVCGGAVIDFLGGKVERAPRWVRRAGMEWAYRLVREPRRLFLRYVIGNPLFMLRAWRCRAAWAR